MNWSGPNDLKAKLMRLWERGDLLREALADSHRFPLRLPLRTPDSTSLSNRFDEVRSWAAELAKESVLRLEMREVQHRVQGAQQLPACAWIDTLEDALRWLHKLDEWNRFAGMVETTRNSLPNLLPWMEKHPQDALTLESDWLRLLVVVSWLVNNPHPNIYLRQVDIPGVHTKFIEAHRGVLSELLDLALPAEAVDYTKSGSRQFAARYGFLDKPVLIRFRVLDPGIAWGLNPLCPDIALDAESFSRLCISARRVFIIENEVNYLAFPYVSGSIAIFGAGYGWEALSRCQWLRDCAIHYWGDIDTHGFGILDQLRAHFDHVNSFLMDEATLHAHSALWGVEGSPLRTELFRLTQEERTLYHSLRDNTIKEGLRLEQEHIGFGWLTEQLSGLIRDSNVLHTPTT